jgi:FAD/FMN-containing dehydrogenase/Fe-S oxidoreductase
VASANGGRVGDPQLAARLRRETRSDVLFDRFSRGRYSTDASIYQVEPIGVVVPRSWQDVCTTIQIAAEEDIPVLPRGGGTSQCGQTVGEALVIDVSKSLNRVIEVDTRAQRAIVEPGLVLEQFNNMLAAHGLWFAVDVSTANRATLGGMTGNNSCGTRSIRYGTMRDNVAGVDAILIDGSRAHLGPLEATTLPRSIRDGLLALGRREAQTINQGFPDLMRRVGGYNIDALVPAERGENGLNLGHLLVGSEGTLAFCERLHLQLHPVPPHRTLGICHFPSFYGAMDAAQHLVKLGPSAVELVDHTMIGLSRDIPMFRDTIAQFVRGEPAALLLVEFAGDDHTETLHSLRQLVAMMGDLGFPGAVVEAIDPGLQKRIWEVRKAGLNIMMSMKGDGKPVSFIEDCAVRLEDLAEYTNRLTAVFEKHGTTGTWYAHASVGCLHVRPVLNLKLEADARKMRAIAEEAFAMVREYKGSHSGEHGDGLVRSEFHRSMFGDRMTANFAEVKGLLDPRGLFNPGKIVDPPRMDDRALFRYKPGYHVPAIDTALDWSEWHGFAGAVEMCNNNGACRKIDANVMCPSYRVTRDEQHLTRGRANSLRLALSGQLGPGALTSREMYETMKLCVGCKGCKRECPTGVDMAKMKVEFLHHYHRANGLPLRERLIAYLPRYAATAARIAPLLNLRNRSGALARLGERLLGLSAQRSLPRWQSRPFADVEDSTWPPGGKEVVLFADTFNRYFEPDNLHAATRILHAAGYRVRLPRIDSDRRPLCCGRTFLAAGLVSEARRELRRTLTALAPFLERGVPILGLEPSCLFTFRDELLTLLPGADSERAAQLTQLLEEFLAARHQAGALDLPLRPLEASRVLLHGHCHQKAFATMEAVGATLSLIPGLEVGHIRAGCCGMAGAFGYGAETHEYSMKMAELDLLPAVRDAGKDTLIVADGTSCRHQIADGTGRAAWHLVRLLDEALADRESG